MARDPAELFSFERFSTSASGRRLAAATGGQPPSIEPQFFEIHNQDHAMSRV